MDAESIQPSLIELDDVVDYCNTPSLKVGDQIFANVKIVLQTEQGGGPDG